jgi:L-arabinokinase
VALGNFSWSWIYEGYAAADPWFAGAAARLRAAEAQADLCLALEMGGGLEVFQRRLALPPVARPPAHDRAEVRAALFPDGDDRPLVLLSFGGFGDELDLDEAARRNPGLDLVVVSASVRSSPPNLRVIDPSPALTHPDLVAAADVVLGKPGYGTVAECLHRPTPLVYAPRGAFREHPALVAAIEARLPSAPITVEDLTAGRWARAIAEALLGARPPERGDGAGLAAERIASLIA